MQKHKPPAQGHTGYKLQNQDLICFCSFLNTLPSGPCQDPDPQGMAQICTPVPHGQVKAGDHMWSLYLWAGRHCQIRKLEEAGDADLCGRRLIRAAGGTQPGRPPDLCPALPGQVQEAG